jgi:hypothetical protein
MRKALLAAMALTLCALAFDAGAKVDVDLHVNIAPPPLIVEAPPPPRPGYVWAPGYWEWRGGRHHWKKAHWVRARPGYVWDPPHWVERGGAWYFVPGRWVHA